MGENDPPEIDVNGEVMNNAYLAAKNASMNDALFSYIPNLEGRISQAKLDGVLK